MIAPGVLDIDRDALSRDELWMYRCLGLAVEGAGRVSPNPLVGAVLVGPGGRVLGEGSHQVYGGSHAEVHAIAEAERNVSKDILERATLYVNLEPCNHWGKTPPCTDLLLQYGISELVVGMADPFRDTPGAGLARLREEGVDVREGVLQNACYRLNEAYLHHLKTARPLVTVKMAQTLDGAIATASGDSRWISGKASRTLVHQWRAWTDAVLVGTGTARNDDPRLTVRHVDGPQPLRVVLDRRGSLPEDLHLFTDQHVERTMVVTGRAVEPAYATDLRKRGGSVLKVPEFDGHLRLEALLNTLGRLRTPEGRTVQSVFVEAGSGLSTALFRKQLVDRLFLFIAPKLLGGGKPMVGDLGIGRMEDAISFGEGFWTAIGEDMLYSGYRHEV
jgi:diaminohydroxyphosphoribosylaminopyrimidine deaminase/5-amino-6-(5-phosphoribosylamino)uracil reductase